MTLWSSIIDVQCEAYDCYCVRLGQSPISEATGYMCECVRACGACVCVWEGGGVCVCVCARAHVCVCGFWLLLFV